VVVFADAAAPAVDAGAVDAGAVVVLTTTQIAASNREQIVDMFKTCLAFVKNIYSTCARPVTREDALKRPRWDLQALKKTKRGVGQRERLLLLLLLLLVVRWRRRLKKWRRRMMMKGRMLMIRMYGLMAAAAKKKTKKKELKKKKLTRASRARGS
jgi:hypothetical protein